MKFKSDKQRKAVMAKIAEGTVKSKVNRTGLKGESDRDSGVGLTKKTTDSTPTNLKPFIKKVYSERDVKLLQRRINDGKVSISDLDKIPSMREGSGVSLTEDQNSKGKRWLINQWKSPTGKERVSNPYGRVEEGILSNFKEIKLRDFYTERGNWYQPYYRVVSKDGDWFEYVVSGGKINILA